MKVDVVKGKAKVQPRVHEIDTDDAELAWGEKRLRRAQTKEKIGERVIYKSAYLQPQLTVDNDPAAPPSESPSYPGVHQNWPLPGYSTFALPFFCSHILPCAGSCSSCAGRSRLGGSSLPFGTSRKIVLRKVRNASRCVACDRMRARSACCMAGKRGGSLPYTVSSITAVGLG